MNFSGTLLDFAVMSVTKTKAEIHYLCFYLLLATDTMGRFDRTNNYKQDGWSAERI